MSTGGGPKSGDDAPEGEPAPDRARDEAARDVVAAKPDDDDKKAEKKKADDKKADDKAADDKTKADDKAADDKKQADKKAAEDKADEEKRKADEKAEAEADAKKAEAKAKKQAEDKRLAEEKRLEDDKRRAEAAEAERLRIPPAPPWWKSLRADPPPHIRLALGVGFIALLFALWWFLTRGDMVQLAYNGRKQLLDLKILPSVERMVQYQTLPSPGDVFGSLSGLWERELLKNLFDTLERVLWGVGLAAIVGIGLGILSAAHRGVNSAIMPLVIFLRSVPMGALIPLTVALFGTSESQKTRFIFLAVVPFVFSDTVKAISIVPDRYIETALTLGASRWQIIRKVLIPLALPDIITSLRFLFGLALGYIMLAEEINTEYGIGKLILGSQRQGPIEHMYLVLFVIAFVALLIDFLMRTIQRGVFAWRKDL